MKIVTAFTFHHENVPMMMLDYMETDETGKVLERNKRQSFVVVDQSMKTHLEAIEAMLNERLAGE